MRVMSRLHVQSRAFVVARCFTLLSTRIVDTIPFIRIWNVKLEYFTTYMWHMTVGILLGEEEEEQVEYFYINIHIVENTDLFTSSSLSNNENYVTLTSLEHVTCAVMSTFNHFSREPCGSSSSWTSCTIGRSVCRCNCWRSRTRRSSLRHHARTRWLPCLPHRQGCLFLSERFRGIRCNENITITQICGIIIMLTRLNKIAVQGKDGKWTKN